MKTNRSTQRAHDLLEAARGASRLHGALATLEPRGRQLLALAFFRGLTHEEIAAHTTMPLGSVKSVIRRVAAAVARATANHPSGERRCRRGERHEGRVPIRPGRRQRARRGQPAGAARPWRAAGGRRQSGWPGRRPRAPTADAKGRTKCARGRCVSHGARRTRLAARWRRREESVALSSSKWPRIAGGRTAARTPGGFGARHALRVDARATQGALRMARDGRRCAHRRAALGRA